MCAAARATDVACAANLPRVPRGDDCFVAVKQRIWLVSEQLLTAAYVPVI